MTKTKYHRLRGEERALIYGLNKAGKTQKEIADEVGCSQSTISKELRRNKGLKGYRYKQAQRLADNRQKAKPKRAKIITGDLAKDVERRLRLKHSPQQISLCLQSVSHETIYKYIYRDRDNGGDLYEELRINYKRRYRHRGGTKRSKIPHRIGIEQRPDSVEKRLRYGDWEADLIEGSQGSGYLLSLYERKTRLGLLTKLATKTKEETTRAILNLLEGYKVRTITYDNGNEFAGHKEISSKTRSKAYFCKPYHSWEKGGVENYNGLVRQYFRKGSSFAHITPDEIKAAQDEINQRPRKILAVKSPSELEYKIAA